MSVIGSWIKNAYNNVKVRCAESTKSEYYNLPNGVTIRVSDHFKQKFDNTYDIQIVISKNHQTVYMMQCEDCLHVYTFTCAEVKSFIKNYVLLCDIRKFKPQQEQSALSTETLTKKQRRKNKDIERELYMNEHEARIGDHGFSVFASELSRRFKKYHEFTPSSRKLVRRLAAQPVTFDEIVRCLNSAMTVNGRFDVDVFRRVVENYEKVSQP